MNTFSNSITIEKPIEEVFEAVTDFETFPEWRTGLKEAKITSSGPIKQGTTYLFNIKTMGRMIETTGEVEQYQPPFTYAWKATSGPFPMSGKVTCRELDHGTCVIETLSVDPGGFFKLAEPLLIRQQRNQMEKDLQRFKALLENDNGKTTSLFG